MDDSSQGVQTLYQQNHIRRLQAKLSTPSVEPVPLPQGCMIALDTVLSVNIGLREE